MPFGALNEFRLNIFKNNIFTIITSIIMLREKKFNRLKHLGLNKLFDYSLDDKLNMYDINYDIDVDYYTSDILIKNFKNGRLIKETSLDPYILQLDDIIVLHVSQDFIKDFEFLYKKSTDYVFDIYQTSTPDLKTEEENIMYHIFCISKKITLDMDFLSFLKANDCDKRYMYLSVFYGPCILVNKRFDLTTEIHKYNARYKFIKTIGKGMINNYIRSLIKHFINISNSLQESLPPHYLKIN